MSQGARKRGGLPNANETIELQHSEAAIVANNTSSEVTKSEEGKPSNSRSIRIDTRPLLEIIQPEIEATISRLTKKKFKPDPLVGTHYSQIVSVMSSAYKRHGFILEKAILNQLRKCPRLEVWDEPEFHVSENADLLVNNKIKNPQSIIGNLVSYEPGPRTLQVDIVVYDKLAKTIRAYEVKRGFGIHDAGKKRSILRDILCLNVLLKSYGEKRGYEIKTAEAKGIFYYGKRSIPKDFSLCGNELDDHFQWQSYQAIEQVNTYFQAKLYEYCKSQEHSEDVWASGEADTEVLGMSKSKPFGLGETTKDFADLTEEEIYRLLVSEVASTKRKVIAMRLHQRYTALRAEREKLGLLKKLNQKSRIR